MSEELTVEEQLEKMKAALDRYKKENEKFRTERDEYKAQLENGPSDETLARWKSRVVRAEAKNLLSAEGITDSDRLVKRMDLDSVSINDDDEVEGLSEQVKALKSDFPELFDKKRRVAGGADGSSQGTLPQQSATERAVSRIFNK